MNMLHLYKQPMSEADFAAFLIRRFTILDSILTDDFKIKKVEDVDATIEYGVCKRHIATLTDNILRREFAEQPFSNPKYYVMKNQNDG